MEISSRVIVCVNLMDEAEKKQIRLDLPLLSRRLGVPVIGVCARKKETLAPLLNALDQVTASSCPATPVKIRYPEAMEYAIHMVEPLLEEKTGGQPDSRWLSLRLLNQDSSLLRELSGSLGEDFLRDPNFCAVSLWQKNNSCGSIRIPDSGRTLSSVPSSPRRRGSAGASSPWKILLTAGTDFKIDRLLTSRITGFPLMLLLLAVIFWITISGRKLSVCPSV